MRRQRVDQRGQSSVGPSDRIRAGVAHGPVDASAKDVSGTADHGGDQCFLGREVEVESALGSVGGGSDLLHLRVRIPTLRQDTSGRVEQLLSAFDRPGLTRLTGHHRRLQCLKNPTLGSVSVLYQHV